MFGLSRPYLQWIAFLEQTRSTALRGCMMDLHWFVNNASATIALRDLGRFFYYLWRLFRAQRVAVESKGTLILVIDTPGVGGMLTLLPLLDAQPADQNITLAVTDYLDRNPTFRTTLGPRLNVDVVNIDRCRGPMSFNRSLCHETLALIRKFPRIWATVPLFLLRHHAYSGVARALLRRGAIRSLVVFNERMLPSATFSEAARSIGVHTVAVQHGNFVDNYLPVLVDRYFTWGEFHSKWLEQRSRCATEVIGAPRLDALKRRKREDVALPVDRALHIVFFSQVGAASVSPGMIRRTRLEILKLLEDTSIRLTIKLHPLDSEQNWLNEGSQAQRICFVPGTTSLDEALADADVVCSFYSTVLAEALLWDLPVVQLNPFPDQVAFFPSRGGIAAVADATELLQLLARLRRSPPELQSLIDHQRTLREGYFSNIGMACTRFWQALSPCAIRSSTPVP
jgi:hypothetical protein